MKIGTNYEHLLLKISTYKWFVPKRMYQIILLKIKNCMKYKSNVLRKKSYLNYNSKFKCV